ncbi:MAG: DMT family transporter [Chlorobi bacterium]|nr:MAG: DMT family transporter [Bacteroidota bacterium]KXK33705.1 MAG: DMT superfamily drug/metabolite permease [Chlorobi bacterium OLB6]MBE2265533.1 DMT family transporter [Flavobacteriales bacterium]MBL1160701.1 DMT family transporter [Chlorobiota bacterium]MBW7853052.1 DMT family transporter [Candidatus Kapabacteria bacterium]MCC6331459.1 DMT family transporter [Ignavibacteria bacterium]
MTRLRAEAYLLTATALWSATFLLTQASFQFISPSGFVFFRFCIAIVVSVALWHGSLRSLTPGLLIYGIGLGVLYGIGFVLQSIALQDVSTTTSAFITGTTVVFIPFIYRMFYRKRIPGIHWLGAAAVLLGLFLFTEPEYGGVGLGDILTMVSAVGWAGYIVMLDKLTTAYSGSDGAINLLIIIQFTVTALLALLASAIVDSSLAPVVYTSELVMTLLYCGILATVVTTWIQTTKQRFTHPVRAGIIFSLEPIFASTLALLLAVEQWNYRQFTGAVVLMLAVVTPDLLTYYYRKND